MIALKMAEKNTSEAHEIFKQGMTNRTQAYKKY